MWNQNEKSRTKNGQGKNKITDKKNEAKSKIKENKILVAKHLENVQHVFQTIRLTVA